MLKENVTRLLSTLEKGNNLGEPITLVCATKMVSPEIINESITYGVKVVAENKVSEFRDKHDKIVGASQHFIGHLQTNKVKYLVGKVSLIHSIDSLHLAEAVSKEATKKGVIQNVLVQINIGKEDQKGGLQPENCIKDVKTIASMPSIKVLGLMAMLPLTEVLLSVSLPTPRHLLSDVLSFVIRMLPAIHTSAMQPS